MSLTARAMTTGAPRSARRSALSARCGTPAPLSWLWRPRKPAACTAPQRAEEPHGHSRADLPACPGDDARSGQGRSAGMETNRENLTLTEAALAACHPIVGEGGHVLRALCPFHGSDRQRSLRVQVHSGRFVCFACGAWGYTAEARERWRDEQQRQAAFQRPAARPQRAQRPRPAAAVASKSAARPPVPREPAPARRNLTQQLAVFQTALPGSPGAAYLQQRGIPLALAQQCGVGYAAPGTWPPAARDWRGGRVVFPHTTPEGCLVNLYGRAVGTA